jgi:hypothetical protein
MKSKKNLYTSVLKILFLVSWIFINNSMIYGQETMEEAILSISFNEENNAKTIVATVKDQEGQPIEELDLYFYVERSFSLLPIGDIFNTTDENGMVEVEFPSDLPGDSKGNVAIVVKILESDIYKDQSLEMTKKWGVPVQLDDESLEKRSLWAAAANAPISLIVVVCLMIIGVWYVIIYIVYILFIISKIESVN